MSKPIIYFQFLCPSADSSGGFLLVPSASSFSRMISERQRWQKVYAFMETLLAFLGSGLGIAALCFAGAFAIGWYLLWRSRRKLSQS